MKIFVGFFGQISLFLLSSTNRSPFLFFPFHHHQHNLLSKSLPLFLPSFTSPPLTVALSSSSHFTTTNTTSSLNPSPSSFLLSPLHLLPPPTGTPISPPFFPNPSPSPLLLSHIHLLPNPLLFHPPRYRAAAARSPACKRCHSTASHHHSTPIIIIIIIIILRSPLLFFSSHHHQPDLLSLSSFHSKSLPLSLLPPSTPSCHCRTLPRPQVHKIWENWV